jgi:hypothetical protein
VRVTDPPFTWPHGKRCAVSLTFDDARLSQPEVGIPILNTHGVRATFYVSFGSLEMRLPQWRQAVAAGHEIGNHTVTHPCSGNFAFVGSNPLEDYTLERMDAELAEANARIEALLGVTPATFAYPCGQKQVGRGVGAGSYVPLIARRFVAGRGFMDEDANDPSWCDLAQLMAVPSDGLSIDEALDWVRRAEAEQAWLVFAGHEIGAGGRQTTLADTLDAVCAYSQDPAHGIWIDTVEAIGRYVLAQRSAS